MTDTIYALATAPGRAAVAVVRLSGPGVGAALNELGARHLKPRRASMRSLVGADGEVLDQALVLWFPGPASYTGEDCGELHLHGGAAVVDAVMAALSRRGLRLADAGEFTRRAFENGKLDLGQAEAVADLVDAESAAQARQALGQLAGALGARYRDWRARLVGILANLEAAVDFPDEEVPAEVEQRARLPLRSLVCDLDSALADGRRGRQVRDGYKVAVIGAPNAGKSSLFNALVGREAAIVTPVAGTTRDVIEASLRLSGYELLVADMAGVRLTDDCIEAEGVRRAKAWATAADRRIWVVDQAAEGDGWRQGLDLVAAGDLCAINKIDLPASEAAGEARAVAEAIGLTVVDLELVSGNADEVLRWLRQRVVEDLSGADFPATTRLRHERQLRIARAHVHRACEGLADPELAAEDVRMAVRALAAVTGEVGVEDVLDQLFAAFCIGK